MAITLVRNNPIHHSYINHHTRPKPSVIIKFLRYVGLMMTK